MRAAVLTDPGKIELKDVADPEIGKGEILIQVKACAICGTDIKICKYGYTGINYPFILGHELAGIIVELKNNNAGFKVGDRVTINPNIPCENCFYCRAGLQTACDNLRTIGVHINGGFADFIRIPEQAVSRGCVFHIPENVSFEEATLIDPVSCAVNQAELSGIKKGDVVVVIGAGPAGCLNVEVSKIYGAEKTILIQRSEQRLQQAAFVNADVYINSSIENPLQRILEETNGRGTDVVIVACASGEAQELAVKMVAKRGVINLFGGLQKGSRFIEFDSNSIHYKESYITGTHGCSNSHCKKGLDMIASGKVKAEEYLSSEFDLSEFHEAFKMAESKNGFKIIVKPNQ